ncbi:COPI associated protein-domain-containing protein [Pilobolus umbonatus]|nr:COPI associated protein-domain-containing protein [Pilobolus umbonatus]
MTNLSLIFRVANIIVAAFMVIGGVMTCIAGGFPNFIQGIFVILFGVMTMVFEFKLPGFIIQFASFMFSFLGRGVFYIFIGCITLNYGGLAIASGVIIIVCGVAYVILQFVQIEAPSNMQKTAYEETLGYSSRVDDSPYINNPTPNPTYPSANYTHSGAV